MSTRFSVVWSGCYATPVNLARHPLGYATEAPDPG
jgi:hypothetical protein